MTQVCAVASRTRVAVTRFALGNTEEALRASVLGIHPHRPRLPVRCPPGPAHRPRMAVAATSDHDYADAQRRGNPVTLLVSENTGALSAEFVRCLRALSMQSRVPATT